MFKKFTLIELLVVIAIVSILFSMLMPALSKAREKTKTAVELSNRGQLMKVTIMYANDNSGYLPERPINTHLHTVYKGVADLNESLLEKYCDSKEYNTREAMFFCNSSLNDVRNQKTIAPHDYSYVNATVQLNNTLKPVLISGFDISSLSKGSPEYATWNCMAFAKSNGKYFGHDTPEISGYFSKGASTAFFDGSAQWMSVATLRPFSVFDGTYYIPVK